MTIRRLGRTLSSGLILLLGSIPASRSSACEEPPEDLLVAFIGDQARGAHAVAVLNLILARGADAVVHSGDFDYSNSPAAWEAQIDAVLGSDFPYFASAGNHDVAAWGGPGGYGARIRARLDRLGIAYEGTPGVAAHVEWNGLSMVFVSPGVFQNGDTESAPYLAAHFAHSDCLWRIASWHENQHLMQAGGKANDVGWESYETARRAGAIIATAHEHSYSRTHLLSDVSTQAVAAFVPPGSLLPLVLLPDDPTTAEDEGGSFVFVSGLGGNSIRNQETSGPWFASVYTSNQGAHYGALFCAFHTALAPAQPPDPRLARCWFEAINGDVPDEFSVISLAEPFSCGLLGPELLLPVFLVARRRLTRRRS